MKSFIIISLILLASFNINIQISTSIRCFWINENDYSVFDLKPLQLSASEKNDKEFAFKSYILKYNFCEVILDTCKDKKGQVILYNNNDKKDCSIISGVEKNKGSFSLIDENNNEKGVKITFNDGETCSKDSTKTNKITWNINCNNDGNNGEIKIDSIDDQNPCQYIVNASSKNGCPKVNFYVVLNFIEKNRYYIGAFIILIGIFLSLLGLKLLKITMFVVSVIFSLFFLFILIFQLIIPNGTKEFVVYIILGCSLILGIIIGIATVYYRKIFFGILGGCLGYIIGLILYTIALKYIQINPTVVYWVTIVGCIILFAILAMLLVKLIVIIGTSAIGSYGVIRGISLYAGHFPSETMIIDLINNEEYDKLSSDYLTWQVYLYLGCWLILTVLTIIFQFRINKDVQMDSEDKKVEEKDDEFDKSEYQIHRRLV